SQLKTGHPVRSAIHKQLNGRLVLRWVTTWESLLLYVLLAFLARFIFFCSRTCLDKAGEKAYWSVHDVRFHANHFLMDWTTRFLRLKEIYEVLTLTLSSHVF
ncbi:hypothetical protein KCV07_g9992, partial [Aureobasidium melanogenum]